jgi:hypothetical protein
MVGERFQTVRYLVMFVLAFMTNATGNEEERYSGDIVMDYINAYSKKIKSELEIKRRVHGLRYFGDDKIYDGKIHVISLGFSIDKRMPYKTARELFYKIVDGLLSHLNQESLGEYFYHYPLTYDDLWFSLSFDYEDKGLLKNGDISDIYIFEKKIMYFVVKREELSDGFNFSELAPGICTLEGSSEKTTAYTRPLPEKGDDLDLLLHKK